jgi:hypothetical protein
MHLSHTSRLDAARPSSLRKLNDRGERGLAREDVPAIRAEAFDFSKHPQAARNR